MAGEQGKIVYIYGLADPMTGEIRYVGKSVNPKERLRNHLTWANNKPPTCHRDHWLKSVSNQSLRPIIVILEETTEEAWVEAEQRHIARLRALGLNLVNSTEGGEGSPGRAQSKYTKQRVSETQRARQITEETRQRMISAHMGKTHGEETKAKMAAANKQRHLVCQSRQSTHSKFTYESVAEIRRRFADSEATITSMAEEFKVTKKAIKDIIHYRTWSNPPSDAAKRRNTEIKQRYDSGDGTYESLSAEYGLSPKMIGYIVREKTGNR